ncbi:MAG: deoxyuridine 5'-triphosphate nucleotidohydrolase [Halodesulfurarchaeum sp.]
MFRSGAFVADQLGDVEAEQVQPNGVDLRLDAILEPVEPGSIFRDGTTIGERDPLETVALEDGDGSESREGYRLDPGGYVLQYAETVSIPEEHVGFLLPRSSLMRNGVMLNTAVWDAGYTGRGEGLLQVHHEIELERGARVAQLVLAAADHEGTYAGSYQGERLDRA